MTEPLAGAFLWFLVGTGFIWIKKDTPVFLPLGGIFQGGLFLTRPAGIGAFPIFAGMLLIAMLKNPRKNLVWVLLALTIFAVISLFPSFKMYRVREIWAPTPIYGWTKFIHALQVASPEDVLLLPDDEAKKFFLEALARKKEEDLQVLQGRNKQDVPQWEFLPSNLFKVALPLGSNHGYDLISVNPLFDRISRPILQKRFREHWKLVWESLTTAFTKNTRLTIFCPIWGWTILLLFSAVLIRNQVAIFALSLASAHFFHLFIVCKTDIPICRHVFETEFLLPLSLIILILEMIGMKEPLENVKRLTK